MVRRGCNEEEAGKKSEVEGGGWGVGRAGITCVQIKSIQFLGCLVNWQEGVLAWLGGRPQVLMFKARCPRKEIGGIRRFRV